MTEQRRLFYVLPKLFIGHVPFFTQFVKTKHVSLEVSSPHLPVVPGDEKIRLSRPLPNKGYVVGHGKENRMGWFVPIPQDIERFDLPLAWEVHVPEINYWKRVEHLLHVELLPLATSATGDEPLIWSMDVMPWCRLPEFDRGEPPVNVQPTSRAFLDEIHSVRHIVPLKSSDNVISYGEDLVIPPVTTEVFTEWCTARGCGIDTVIPSCDMEATHAGGGE
ncbi:hypothetical protein HFU84_06780 [Acidithiobacillus sp. CV18-2]|nr:hypothetical protein [Acidithiobacillus sp. CV18-3]MBU2757508.1 hypothetical protein [Acidithiobacillus sp. BN09-2]MBU2777210.1 hypothetical protein [Acidithiobacillus sp. CV18-2]MBU2799941.1 hypothetical protein [Acidithiobacillus sp. VAN18-4]